MNKRLTRTIIFSSLFLFSACTAQKSEEVASPTPDTVENHAAASFYLTNQTGNTITELYLYPNDSEQKGHNYALDTIADTESITITFALDEETFSQKDLTFTIAYVPLDGEMVTVYDKLLLSDADIYLKPAADIKSGATPFTKK